MSYPQPLLAVDATCLGPARTGIENFTHQLLPRLAAEWGEGRMVAFARDPALLSHVRPPLRALPGGGPLWTQVRLPFATRGIGAALLYNPIPILPLALPLPCPAVVTVHDLHEFRHHWNYTRLLLTRTFARAAGVVVVSQATREEVLEEFPSVAPKLTIVHEGADPAVFHPSDPGDDHADTLRRHGLAAAPLLAVGTIQPRKNYVRMIRAYARLGEGAPPLVIVGGHGWQAEDVLALPASLGLAGRVQFTGHLPEAELGQLMRASALLLALSTGEGFGLPVLEAMYSGVPILASDIPPFREVAGNAARFVDPRDEAAIAAAIERLLASPGERAEMAQAGLGRRSLFTWERTAAGVAETLRRALTNAPLTRTG